MVDSHIHLQDLSSQRRDALLSYLCDVKSTVLFCNGTSPKDWSSVLSMADRTERVKPFIGVHPWFVDGLPRDWEDQFVDALRHGSCGAGEIGLDKTPRGGDFETQKNIFVRQLDIAVMLKRVFVVHCVQAWGPIMSILRAYDFHGVPFIVHSFIGFREILQELLSMGAMISISQRSLKQDRIADIMSAIPMERLLLETDFPYLPGLEKDRVGVEEYRQAIQDVYNRTAELRGVPLTTVFSHMCENAEKILDHI